MHPITRPLCPGPQDRGRALRGASRRGCGPWRGGRREGPLYPELMFGVSPRAPRQHPRRQILRGLKRTAATFSPQHHGHCVRMIVPAGHFRPLPRLCGQDPGVSTASWPGQSRVISHFLPSPHAAASRRSAGSGLAQFPDAAGARPRRPQRKRASGLCLEVLQRHAWPWVRRGRRGLGPLMGPSGGHCAQNAGACSCYDARGGR